MSAEEAARHSSADGSPSSTIEICRLSTSCSRTMLTTTRRFQICRLAAME